MNLQIARTYLAASDPQIATRDWQFVMEEMVKIKTGETQHRWKTAIRDRAFDLIRHLPVLENRPENLLRIIETGAEALPRHAEAAKSPGPSSALGAERIRNAAVLGFGQWPGGAIPTDQCRG